MEWAVSPRLPGLLLNRLFYSVVARTGRSLPYETGAKNGNNEDARQ